MALNEIAARLGQDYNEARLKSWSVVGGALLAWRAVAGWARVERALRLRKALPSPLALATLAGGVIVLAALMIAVGVVELLRP